MAPKAKAAPPKAAPKAKATQKPKAAKRPGKPAKQRRGKRALGQADKLPGAAWTLWTHHVQTTGPSWLYPVICLGHLLCLRVTEVPSLRGKDLDFENGVVRVRPMKRQGATDKVLSDAAVLFIRKIQEEGINIKRLRNTGLRVLQEISDDWNWPEDPEGLLFPATRRE
jgi:integrase